MKDKKRRYSAFPLGHIHQAAVEAQEFDLVEASAGLTKRELFAAMALQGFCAQPLNHFKSANGRAIAAVEIADCLIEELEK